MLVQISDLYHVSLDDLLREDHKMINNYKEEHTINKRVDKIFVICYFFEYYWRYSHNVKTDSTFSEPLLTKTGIYDYFFYYCF